MPSEPPPLDETNLEWDRLRGFLLADEAPLALIEVESSVQASRTIELLEQQSSGPQVRQFRIAPESAPEAVMDWLTAGQQSVERNALFLVLMLEDVPPDAERGRAFWTWANAQRERWRPARGKLAFVLTPPHVDNLARFADALWDWIPLKFNLLQPRFTGDRHDQMQTAETWSSVSPGDAAKRVPALRQQLQQARERGLAESIIRREYAWPLFKTLRVSGRIRDAETVLRNDLSEGFVAELSPAEQLEWLVSLGYLRLDAWRIHEAEQAFRDMAEGATKQDDEPALAVAYCGLGRVAAASRRFDTAEKRYLDALAMAEKQGNEHLAAIAHHQLGSMAHEQRDFAAADQWYRKSLAITEEQGDEHGAASTYGQLGSLGIEQRDFATAEQWYRKAVEVFERLNIKQHAAIAYHQLGTIALEQRDFGAAEQWYRKSVETKENQGNEHGAAITYHQLGRLAEEQRDFGAAKQWYRKSLAIEEKQGNEHGAAMTYGQLGILAGLQEQFEDAGRWLIKCVETFARCNDPHGAQRNASNFMVVYGRAPADAQVRLAAMWRDAGLGELPDVADESSRSAGGG